QTGPEYLSGKIVADYLDELDEDVIATERQRLNWEKEACIVLEAWGQTRIKQLLGIWKSRRVEHKEDMLENKIENFASRIEALGRFEGKIVKRAIKQLARIEKINNDQFLSLGSAILTAWEGGRLKELISALSDSADLDENKLLEILIEANTIQALHTAEAVKAKMETIRGLEERIKNKELENATRDYIAKNPWLVSPHWETFAVEKGTKQVMQKAAAEAWTGPLKPDPDWEKRIDLMFSSGDQLLLLEFMRPGLTVDHDHLSRFEAYADCIRAAIESNTAGKFKKLTGYLVADKIEKSKPQCRKKVEKLQLDDLRVMDWDTLLSQAYAQWKEFFGHLLERAPEDERLQELAS
ncbi:MAG: hypothetical protein AAF465_10900, partial [Pseudomonadota bacterium]